MNILIVNSYYYPEVEGGAEYSVKMLAETLVKKGNNVTVLCTSDTEKEENINGVNIIRIKSKCLVRTKECYKKNGIVRKCHRLLDVYNPFNYLYINRIVRFIQPDIIHTNCLYDISPVIWHVAKHNKIPTVHTLRDYYLICEHGNMIRRRSGELCVKARILCKIYRLINSIFSLSVNALTAPSEFTLNTVISAKLFTRSEKRVIMNATDLDVVTIKKYIYNRKISLEYDNETINFAFLGNLVEFKGIQWLLECFLNIKNEKIRLKIAGKGKLENLVKEYAKKDSRIEYMGFLGKDDVEDLLLSSYALICPSLWNEPFGRVILDAYQVGLPVIASNAGALPSIVDNEISGLLVEKGNREALITAISRLLDDRELYIRLLDGIPEQAEKFTLEYQANKFFSIYKALTDIEEVKA